MSLAADDTAPPDVASVSYSGIPYIPRLDLWPGHVPVGTPVVYAAAGGTGKGLLFAAAAARVVLGLPFPNEDQAIRRAPARVLWISGQGEDDPWEDLAPRFRAAISSAAAEFGFDPDIAARAIVLIRDLSCWTDGSPVTLPADCQALAAEVAALNSDGGPAVSMVVCDSISALLSDGYTIDSRQGARRVLGRLARFARAADVALPLLHHMTKDGKVAGSAGLMDGVRLAFTIGKDPDRPEFRTITQHKANADNDAPQQFVIAGEGPLLRARFALAADARQGRVAQHAARVAAATADPRRARAMTPTPAGPGPFRVLRLFTPKGGTQRQPGELPGPLATREDARAAAVADAGQPVTWTPGERAGMETAVFVRADGARIGYAVCPPLAAG
jgi:hypothetical protein